MRKALVRLKRRQHVDTVTVIVTWMQQDEKSVSVQPGTRTAPEARVRGAIRIAKQLGLRVVLRPHVDREDYGWRGELAPTSLPAWFASYGAFVRRYAMIARRERADGFVVGSEMVTLSDEADSWRRLVADVRRRFKGFVTYQANWGGEEKSVQWWDSLDAISISAYYPLAAGPGATTGQLEAAWRGFVNRWGQQQHIFGTVEELHRRWNRPVMFGEIGYRPVPATAVEPWNIHLEGNDPAAQTRAYEAALRVWHRLPWFRGMHWWYVPPRGNAVEGQPGADHRPSASSLRVLARWYRQGR